jgi:hypothetical protein
MSRLVHSSSSARASLPTPTTGGTATQASGALTLNTGAGPDGGALVTSSRIGRYIPGAQNYYFAIDATVKALILFVCKGTAPCPGKPTTERN